MSDDRLWCYLYDWEQWKQDRRSDFGRGSGNRASGGIGASGSKDFDAMCAEVDSRCAKAVDAILDDLPQAECAAVYHFHLHSVFRFRGPPKHFYDKACQSLKKQLTAKGFV